MGLLKARGSRVQRTVKVFNMMVVFGPGDV